MLQSLVINKVLGPFIRHGATALGGWMVAQGYADENAVSEIVGGLVAFGGVALSFVEKQIRA